jgi:hypothetical protein
VNQVAVAEYAPEQADAESKSAQCFWACLATQLCPAGHVPLLVAPQNERVMPHAVAGGVVVPLKLAPEQAPASASPPCETSKIEVAVMPGE